MKIKIAVGLSILIFYIVATAVLGGYLVMRETNKTNGLSESQTTRKTDSVSDDVIDNTIIKNVTVIDSVEVSKHISIEDCWLIISGNVYNVTNYLNLHPGGISEIQPYCGKEATQAFQTRGGDGTHSNIAVSLLNNYLVGSIGSEVTNTTGPTTSTPTSAPRRSREDDDD